MIKSFLDWIANASNIIGIIAAFFSFLVWLKLKKQNKRLIELAKKTPKVEGLDKLIEYHKEKNTVAPYAFCLALTDRNDSIKGYVEDFLNIKNWKMPIEELNFNGLTHENFEEFISGLRKIRRVFSEKKATEIHLFLEGPIQAAVMVGAFFDNWIPVKIYNLNQQTRQYEYWCPLIKQLE